MSDENDQNLSPWRKKFLASRMALESIMFERELVQTSKPTLGKGLLVLAGIWLFNVLLLAQWALRRGYFFTRADADSFNGVLRYASYLNSDGFWALVKPELTGLTLNPPLYYLAYVPVFRFLTTDLNLALILVNSFFLLVLALAVFLALRASRTNAAGWFGAAFALAMPFVMETARRPAPEMALMALVAAMYACYIRSDEFLDPKWSFAFAVCVGLGFFSHRFFWLYALPLAPFIMAGLANPNARDELFKGFFPGFVVNLPWYVFAAAVVGAGMVPLWGDYHGFWHYFKLGMAATGLPLFWLGFAALVWMYYSVFMPYGSKKVVAALFWAPYLILAWGLRGSRPELLYPGLLAFPIAAAVMTPHGARKVLLPAVLLLALLNQGGFLRPFPAGKYPVAGLPLPASSDYRAKQLLSLVETSAPAEGGLAAVYGDSNLNADSLRFAAARKNNALKFADNPACPACAFILIHKTPRFGETPSATEQAFAALKRRDWFSATFDKRETLELPDTSKVEVYARVPSTMKFLEEGSHELRNLALGPLRMEEATLRLAGFDPATGVYARANLFSPAAELLGGDIYGLDLDLAGLALASPYTDPPVPAGIRSVTVRSARITDYAIERYLASLFPFLKDLDVTLDEGMQVTARARGRDLEAGFALAVRDRGVLEVRPAYFSLGPVTVTPLLLRLFTFRLDFRDNPYGLRLEGVRITRQTLELY